MTNTGKERIKASIKKKITAYALVAFLSSALLIISQRPSIASLYAKSGHADFMQGFVVGMVIAIEIVCVYQISKYINALKDEKCFWVRDAQNLAEINKTIILSSHKLNL